MSTSPEQLELLRAVMAWEPKAWIFGGFAEDAVLHGRASRPHDDLDVLVLREDLDARLEQAAAMGYAEIHVRLMAVAGRPLVVGCWNDRGALLELGVFDRDDEGRVYWEKPTPRGTTRLYLPADAFDAPAARFEGVDVRTLSPLALHQIRAGLDDLFQGRRPKDVVAQAALRERFFQDATEAELAPRLVAEATS